MIVLDTHIWIWWVHGDARLTTLQVAWLEQYESQGLGRIAESCIEHGDPLPRALATLPEGNASIDLLVPVSVP